MSKKILLNKTTKETIESSVRYAIDLKLPEIINPSKSVIIEIFEKSKIFNNFKNYCKSLYSEYNENNMYVTICGMNDIYCNYKFNDIDLKLYYHFKVKNIDLYKLINIYLLKIIDGEYKSIKNVIDDIANEYIKQYEVIINQIVNQVEDV